MNTYYQFNLHALAFGLSALIATQTMEAASSECHAHSHQHIAEEAKPSSRFTMQNIAWQAYDAVIYQVVGSLVNHLIGPAPDPKLTEQKKIWLGMKKEKQRIQQGIQQAEKEPKSEATSSKITQLNTKLTAHEAEMVRTKQRRIDYAFAVSTQQPDNTPAALPRPSNPVHIHGPGCGHHRH